MTAKKSIRTIFVISGFGLLFSGYLSYQELFAGGCDAAFINCDSSFSLFSLPACVYGFFMYLSIFIISLLGIRSKK